MSGPTGYRDPMTYRVTVAEAEAHRAGDCRRDCPVCQLEEVDQ